MFFSKFTAPFDRDIRRERFVSRPSHRDRCALVDLSPYIQDIIILIVDTQAFADIVKTVSARLITLGDLEILISVKASSESSRIGVCNS